MKELFETKNNIRKLEQSLGIDHLSDPAINVYAYIHKGPTTITEISKHAFFERMSLSTVKRMVGILSDEGLVGSTVSKSDLRQRILYTTGV